MELQPAEGAVQVSDGSVNVLVSLTSAVMREPAGTTPHRTDTNTDTDTDTTRPRQLHAMRGEVETWKI